MAHDDMTIWESSVKSAKYAWRMTAQANLMGMKKETIPSVSGISFGN